MKNIKHHKNTIKYIFQHLLHDIDKKYQLKNWFQNNTYLVALCIASLLIRIYKTYGYMYSVDPTTDFVYQLDIYGLNIFIIIINIVYFVLICYMWAYVIRFIKKLYMFYTKMMKEANEN